MPMKAPFSYDPENSCQIGPYRLQAKRPLRGTWTVVYHVQDATGKHCMLKAPQILYQENQTVQQDWDSVMQKFHQGLTKLQKFHYPGLVRIYEIGKQEVDFSSEGLGTLAVPWYTMEYLPGEELVTGLRDANINQRLAALYQLSDTLAYAHSKGWVHGGLKPSNIRFNSIGRPVVMDFGQYEMLDLVFCTLTVSTGNRMPPFYMSPEQLSASMTQQDYFATDVWALGVLFYEVLTQQHPFYSPDEAISQYHLYQQICRLPHRPLREVLPDINLFFDEICRRALEKKPQRRYPNITKMFEHMELDARKHIKDGCQQAAAVYAQGQWPEGVEAILGPLAERYPSYREPKAALESYWQKTLANQVGGQQVRVQWCRCITPQIERALSEIYQSDQDYPFLIRLHTCRDSTPPYLVLLFPPKSVSLEQLVVNREQEECQVLTYAETRAVVHTIYQAHELAQQCNYPLPEINAENIYLDEDGPQAYLLGFGWARAEERAPVEAIRQLLTPLLLDYGLCQLLLPVLDKDSDQYLANLADLEAFLQSQDYADEEGL